MAFFVDGDFQGADQALAGVVVRGVVRGAERFVAGDQFFGGVLLEFGAECGVGRDVGQMVSAGGGLDVEAAAAAEGSASCPARRCRGRRARSRAGTGRYCILCLPRRCRSGGRGFPRIRTGPCRCRCPFRDRPGGSRRRGFHRPVPGPAGLHSGSCRRR